MAVMATEKDRRASTSDLRLKRALVNAIGYLFDGARVKIESRYSEISTGKSDAVKTTVKGDLVKLALEGQFDVIVHGCNCFHTMGAGIAKTIARIFPEAFEADRQTPYGDKTKLGTISTATIQRENCRFIVVNAYTQFQWKGHGRKVDYDAIESCFRNVAARFPSKKIGYPLIGAGLAGGNWTAIEPLIDTALTGQDHTLVVFEG